MSRHPGCPHRSAVLLVLALVLAVASGPVTRAGTPVHDEVPVVLKTPASKADRDRVRAKLSTAERHLPRPSSTFRLAAEGEERGVGSDAGKLDDGSWNPIQAWISRTYETRTASEEEERTLEVNLALNGDRGLSSGLASVGGDVDTVAVQGALALRQSIAGAEEGSRVALPLSGDEVRRALTLVRVYVVPPELESRLRRVVELTSQLPRLDDTHVSAGRPDAIAAVIVEVRGERRDVEALVSRIEVAGLRKLVTR